MSAPTHGDLAHALPIAEEILEKLKPFCDHIIIAGSIRRKKKRVRDIDIVALPAVRYDLLGQPLLDGNHALQCFFDKHNGTIKFDKNGPIIKRFAYRGYWVDLHANPNPHSWPIMATIRTGSMEFNKWIMKPHGWGGAMPPDMRQVGGVLFKNKTPVPLEQEGDFLTALSLPWIPVEDRDDARWLQHIHGVT